MVSGGIREILQVVVDALEFDYLLCSELDVDNQGIYTGKPSGRVCIGENKQLIAQELAQSLNIDLEKSFSYGNHHTDIPILEIVGNPYAVEPTPEFIGNCRRKRMAGLYHD